MKTMQEIYDEVKDAWSDRTLFDKRLETCKTCEFYAASTMHCTECKCWIPIKAHIKFAKCPESKWDE